MTKSELDRLLSEAFAPDASAPEEVDDRLLRRIEALAAPQHRPRLDPGIPWLWVLALLTAAGLALVAQLHTGPEEPRPPTRPPLRLRSPELRPLEADRYRDPRPERRERFTRQNPRRSNS